MHCPAVTDKYIALKSRYNCTYSQLCTYSLQYNSLQYIYLQYISLQYNSPQYIYLLYIYLQNTYLQYIQCTAPLCNFTAPCSMYAIYFSAVHFTAIQFTAVYLSAVYLSVKHLSNNSTIPVKLKQQYYYKINSTTSQFTTLHLSIPTKVQSGSVASLYCITLVLSDPGLPAGGESTLSLCTVYTAAAAHLLLRAVPLIGWRRLEPPADM